MNAITKTKKFSNLGPYSLAIDLNNQLFMSGQIGIDENKNLVSDKTVDQFKKIMENLDDLLENTNYSIKNIVNVKIYLKDVNDFAQINEIYTEYFSAPYPTRTTIGVHDLPLGAKIEVEFLAVKELYF